VENAGEKNAGTGNNVWGEGQSDQAIKLFQAHQKISFFSIFEYTSFILHDVER